MDVDPLESSDPPSFEHATEVASNEAIASTRSAWLRRVLDGFGLALENVIVED